MKMSLKQARKMPLSKLESKLHEKKEGSKKENKEGKETGSKMEMKQGHGKGSEVKKSAKNR